ncbi:MAG: FtsX-like permease family protein [Roseovarius sp.]|nr:FtsX-like permease family protein [Roseovarius sp.]
MSLSQATRLARRELRGGLAGFRIFLACVILGVAAIAAIGTVRDSIQAGLAAQGAALLGGDAELELTYRFADETELAWMHEVSEALSEVADFRSMAVVGDARALTQVKAVDDAYPLVGAVKLDPDMPIAEALTTGGLPGAVMDPALMAQLGLEIGDQFSLGTQDFQLTAALMFEPDNATAGFGLGPRTIVQRAALLGSGLLAPGTLYSTRYRLDLPPGTNLADMESKAEQQFENSGMRWRDARNGAPGVTLFVDRLGAFLVLVGLSGLAVGGVGISAALRGYLAGKSRTIATLRTIGASRRVIFLTYLLQVAALAVVGILVGLALGVGGTLMLSPVIDAQLPVPAIFAPYPAPMLEAAIYSALTVLIFTLWPLARTEDIRAAMLFRDALESAPILPRWPYLVASALLLATLLGIAAWFNGNPTLTFWAAGGIVIALAVLSLAARAVRALARRLRRVGRHRPALGWALAAIGGPGTTVGPVLLSLGLGLSVLATVGQIDGNLRGAIARDLPGKAPSFFFVDLQKDQMPGFLHRVEGDQSVSRLDSAPMLRGIITQINGQPARDVAGDHWVLNGDRGISYAAAPPSRGKVTAGTWWSADYDGPPQVSFSAESAEEMGLHLGDTLTINILGRDITATLTSLRSVDFSTAGMGFVMVMNPSALDAAPHSFIATVYADTDAEAGLMRDITTTYPNVTAIRVRDAIERVSDMLAGLASAVSWGASITLLTGFLVLIGASAADQPNRRYEAAVLKTLGASRARILASLVWRSAVLGAVAGSVALGSGILGSWAVSHYIFETHFDVIWSSAIAIIGAGLGVTLLAGLAFAWGPLTARPAAILRARE